MKNTKDKLLYKKVKDSYNHLYGKDYTEEELMTSYTIVHKIIKKKVIDYAKEQTKDTIKSNKRKLYYEVGR